MLRSGSLSRRRKIPSSVNDTQPMIDRYSLRCEDSFLTQVRAATFDVSNDEANTTRAQKPSQLKWDRKKKRFLPGDTVGADNKKVIRTESGAFLPASYRSGRFKTWQAQKRSSSFSDDIRQSSFGVRGGLDEKRSGGKGAVAKRSGSHGPSGRPKDSLLSAESIRKRRVQSQKV